MTQNELYMMRCLQLARQGRENVAPNPMVGALIVYQDRIIGEGYHRQYGKPHAEVNAIASVKDETLLKDSTIYVSLEPCSHYGKTPPCAQLIINKKIPRVVVGMLDPHDKVAGRGVKMLQEAGIDVQVGICEDACKALNKRFVTFHTQKRPYIILKWAESFDGYIDSLRTNGERKPIRISNEVTKTLNHQIRTQEAAILVGTNTAILDNPHLTSRKWSTKNPLRVVIDRKGRLPENSYLLDHSTPTLVITSHERPIKMLSENQLYYEYVDFSKNIPQQILTLLYDYNINSVIIEGGTQLLQSFIDRKLWDEARIETSPNYIVKGVKAPIIVGSPRYYKEICGQKIKHLVPYNR